VQHFAKILKEAVIMKKIALALMVTLICCSPAFAGSIEEEHQKAKEGGYEKEYEKQMRENEGERTKQEHDKYHQEQEKKNDKTDKEEDYGKTYQEKQLGTDKKIRTW
jgi:hypothetical protein